MPGKVFVSCGQRPPKEKNIAEKVGELLSGKFGLEPYLAFKIQGLHDIMKITEELRSSDYYLFIDFQRKDEDDLPCSLFTHQELALAHHLGFEEVIAFQEKGAPREGFLRYMLANPEPFESEKELLEKLEAIVVERKWSNDYSRNLVLTSIRRTPPTMYADHTGPACLEHIWHATIENRRPDVAAANTVCILDSVEHPDGRREKCNDRSSLKWAGQKEYNRTILPKDFGVIDVFAIHANEPGIFLHSTKDEIPRYCIVAEDGRYKFWYKVFSQGFPMLSFVVQVDYDHSVPTGTEWTNTTEARIV